MVELFKKKARCDWFLEGNQTHDQLNKTQIYKSVQKWYYFSKSQNSLDNLIQHKKRRIIQTKVAIRFDLLIVWPKTNLLSIVFGKWKNNEKGF